MSTIFFSRSPIIDNANNNLSLLLLLLLIFVKSEIVALNMSDNTNRLVLSTTTYTQINKHMDINVHFYIVYTISTNWVIQLFSYNTIIAWFIYLFLPELVIIFSVSSFILQFKSVCLDYIWYAYVRILTIAFFLYSNHVFKKIPLILSDMIYNNIYGSAIIYAPK